MKENPSLSESEASRLASSKWRQIERDGAKEFRCWLREDLGVVSFSSCNDDILMWAHYGGGHNGVCIEFRCTDNRHIDFFSKIQEVSYAKQLPKVNFYETNPVDKVKAFLLTKARPWRYEKEWRIIQDYADQRPRFADLPTGIITAIYLGVKISSGNTTAILDRVQANPTFKDVLIYQAGLHADKYELDFQRCSGSKPE